MKLSATITIAAMALVLLSGCDKPAKPVPPPEQPTVETPAPEPAPVEPVAEKAPDMAVPKIDVEKAAAMYQMLYDDTLDEKAKQTKVTSVMETNGWTEDSYLALLYDITQDPVSRAYYVDLLQSI